MRASRTSSSLASPKTPAMASATSGDSMKKCFRIVVGRDINCFKYLVNLESPFLIEILIEMEGSCSRRMAVPRMYPPLMGRYLEQN